MKYFLYDWGGLNVWLFKMLNAWHADWLDAAMHFASWAGESAHFPQLLALLALLAWFRVKRGDDPMLWLQVLSAFAVGYVAEDFLIGLLKHWFAFPRPFLALPAGEMHLVGVPDVNPMRSLPSGHSAFAAFTAASLWPVLRQRGRWVAVLLAGWVMWSRISLGVHFPADVLLGAAVGAGVAWSVRRCFAACSRWV